MHVGFAAFLPTRGQVTWRDIILSAVDLVCVTALVFGLIYLTLQEEPRRRSFTAPQAPLFGRLVWRQPAEARKFEIEEQRSCDMPPLNWFLFYCDTDGFFHPTFEQEPRPWLSLVTSSTWKTGVFSSTSEDGVDYNVVENVKAALGA